MTQDTHPGTNPCPHTHTHTPQVELSKSPAVAAWLMDVARGRWSGESPLLTKQLEPAYVAACQIALAEPPGDSSVARAVTDALWRAMMVHGSSPAAAVSGLQVLARTAEADGLEDREQDSEEEEDAGEGRQLRVLRALLHHHKACSEVVKLCARYGLARVCSAVHACFSWLPSLSSMNLDYVHIAVPYRLLSISCSLWSEHWSQLDIMVWTCTFCCAGC